MELAAFLGDWNEWQNQWPLATDSPGCPFQVAKLCGVHALRPFGCRMFFCDPSATDWQNETYERFHAELRRLHEAMGVPYRYVEWRAALRALEPHLTGVVPR
jgi:Fe-S-cluster containining protein